jgi:hypothetical protein
MQSQDFNIAESSAKGLPQRVPQPQQEVYPQVSQPKPSNSKRPHEAAETWNQEHSPQNNRVNNPAVANCAAIVFDAIT